jgi:hypothetical protein
MCITVLYEFLFIMNTILLCVMSFFVLFDLYIILHRCARIMNWSGQKHAPTDTIRGTMQCHHMM